jgi:hypothetical protein
MGWELSPISSSSQPLHMFVWGELFCYFWEYFYASFILAFIVDITRTVKQDKCPVSMTHRALASPCCKFNPIC